MTICADCQRAEADPLHAILRRGAPCCSARALMILPRRMRRDAARRLRDAVGADEWSAIRARLDVLIGRERGRND